MMELLAGSFSRCRYPVATKTRCLEPPNQEDEKKNPTRVFKTCFDRGENDTQCSDAETESRPCL